MKNLAIQQMLSPHREGIKTILIDLLTLTGQMAEAYPQCDVLPTTRKNVRILLESIDKPFLFVVMGQVNAGKSSFINALLGQTVCKVDPIPETDAIYELVYSDQEFQVELRPQLQ